MSARVVRGTVFALDVLCQAVSIAFLVGAVAVFMAMLTVDWGSSAPAPGAPASAVTSVAHTHVGGGGGR